MKVQTNNHWRDLIYHHELTPEEKEDLFLDPSDDSLYLRYRGEVYALSEFMRINPSVTPSPLNEWHGMLSDTFFTGILIRLDDEGERCQVGVYRT